MDGQETARRSVSLAPILAVNFIGTLGFSIVLPFLVFLVIRWGGNALVYGLIGATYSAFQLVGAPVLGRWSDHIGRRRVLLLSQLGTLASWAIFLLAFFLPPTPLLAVDAPLLGSFELTAPLLVLFLARACDGITGGNVSVANAYLADITAEEDRAASFGKMAVAANLGFVLGPALAGVLAASAWGERAPVLAALGISLAATLLVALGLPESSPCTLATDPDRGVHRLFGQEPRPCFRIESPARASTRDLLRLAGVARLVGIGFLVMLGFNLYYVAFPVHAASGLGWSVGQTAAYFSALSLLMVLVQGPVLARLAKRWPDGILAAAGSLVLALGFAAFAETATAAIALGVAAVALGNGLMWPSVVALLARAAGPRHQGGVQGLASGSGAVASLVGLVAGGLAYARLGASVFLVCAAILVAVFVMSLPLATVRRAGVPEKEVVS